MQIKHVFGSGLLLCALGFCFKGDDQPKSVQELELAKVKAIFGIKHFHSEYAVHAEFPGASAPDDVKLIQYRDGDRHHMITELPTGKLECLTDGTTHWNVVHPLKVYMEQAFNKPRKPEELAPEAKDGTLQFYITSDAGCIQFAFDPPLKDFEIKTDKVGEETLRLVEASGIGSSGGKVRLRQWFLPDRWILKKFQLDGTAKDGAILLKGEAKKLDFKAEIEQREFELDKGSVAGYEKKGGSLRPYPERALQSLFVSIQH